MPSVCVRFADITDVAFIPALDDFSEKEKVAIWYTRDEIEGIKADCMEIVSKMRAGNTSCSEASTRGLEGLGSYLRKRRSSMRIRVIVGVLSEQKRQRALQMCKPSLLAIISSRNSRWSVTLARSQAASDANVYDELIKDPSLDFLFFDQQESHESTNQGRADVCVQKDSRPSSCFISNGENCYKEEEYQAPGIACLFDFDLACIGMHLPHVLVSSGQ